MEKQLIPQLRFPEFEGKWESDSVNNKAEKLKVGFVGTCEPFYTNKEKGVLLVRTGNLKGVDIILDDVKYVTSNFHKKNIKSQLYPDDLILARHGGKGEICLVPKNFPTANCLNIVILRIDNTINSKYFQLIYGTASIQKQIIAVTAGSTQTVINTKEIGFLKFKFPSLPEQQKIASFLTDVDDKITKLTQKKDLLERYKKGVMQKIFNQELRFKDENGNTFPDWEEKRLGEICVKKSSNLSANSLNENFGKYKIYGATGFLKCIDFYDEETEYIGIVKDGSGVGNNFLAEKYSSVLGTIDKIFSNKKSNIYFLKCLLDRIHFEKYKVGSSIPHIYFKDYSSEKIIYPCIKEQTKIANFLSDIDLKIEALNTKIENSKSFKKGLLQKMFV